MTVRVLVVEDSPTVRERLVEVLGADPDLAVVGTAADGHDALRLCRELRPDVMTLDLALPGLDGLAVTEQVMAYWPTPILVVSAADNRSEALQTYDALAAGALDAIEKPTGHEPAGAWEEEIVSRVKMAARIKVITHPRGRLSGRIVPRSPESVPSPAGRPRAIAIGASTGGPAAVSEVLGALPTDLAVPVLVVIHVSMSFSAALTEWLDRGSKLRVRLARDGEPLPDGASACVLLAPAGAHLVLRGGALRLVDGPERHSCKPSVDELFESVARELGARTVACLLTGIGRDGAEGMLAVKRAGGITIAQDEATSAVYGMPAEAARLGAAERVLPLPEIAEQLARLCARREVR
jgi:two-component system chemotaxis response regulator CheB